MTTQFFDALGTDPAVLANSVVSNSLINYAATKSGLAGMYWASSDLDGELQAAIRSGIWTSATCALGSALRRQWPQLAVFGKPNAIVSSETVG